VNLSDFAKVEGNVDAASLYAAGLVKKNAKVKVLAKGELKKAVNVKVHAISAKAKEAIEKAGGKVEVIAPKAKYQRASK
jgi:large subunit ribosomal protein L15